MTSEVTTESSARLRQWRHHLHRYPELPFEERGTAAYLAQTLTALDIADVTTGVGGTGVVASLTNGTSGRVIGLRADMDCLPLTETSSHAHASVNAGAMHACGHDGHMTMVLGAAAELAEHGGFDGTVRFIFQPAEEPGRGAQAMLSDGLFERFPVDAIFGLHNMPGIPAGQLRTREGAILASEDNFIVRITGRGGHAAVPELVIDPLVVSAEVILALQTVVARNVGAAQSAVLSCTEIITDGSRNAIPNEVVIRGDTRSFDPAVRELLERRIREIAVGICSAYGASCEVTYTHEFETTVNDADCVAAAAAAAREVFGNENVDVDCTPILGSEDFGVFAQAVPGCFSFIGNGTKPGQGGTPLHTGDYDFNDDILERGVNYYATLVRSLLAPAPTDPTDSA